MVNVFARTETGAGTGTATRSVAAGGPWPVHYSQPGQQPNAGYRWPTQANSNNNNPSMLQHSRSPAAGKTLADAGVGRSMAGAVGVGRSGGSHGSIDSSSGPVTILSATTGKLVQQPQVGGSSGRTQARGRGGAIAIAPRSDLAEQHGPPSMAAAAAAVAAIKAAAVGTARGTVSQEWSALHTTMSVPARTAPGGGYSRGYVNDKDKDNDNEWLNAIGATSTSACRSSCVPVWCQ